MARPSSLTIEEMKWLKTLYKKGNRVQVLSELFCLSRSQVWRICRKREQDMSFRRPAGWAMMPAHTGFINHYFAENQTMGLCGVSDGYHHTLSNKPAESVKTCKRCTKYFKMRQLELVKKY